MVCPEKLVLSEAEGLSSANWCKYGNPHGGNLSDRSTPQGPFTSLVVFGESIVEGGGWLKATEQRWADVLQKLLEQAQEAPLAYHNAGLGASVISSGSPGYEASVKPSAAERLQDDVIEYTPTCWSSRTGSTTYGRGWTCRNSSRRRQPSSSGFASRCLR
jgi:hypothetical protein